MDLVLEVAEHPVGGFSLDLKGYDQSSGEAVIVENQLEPSNHTHLGQIITYAAGTEATTIVWITTGFREEHRAAIDWLNQRTDEDTRVFGVVIGVVRIGNSEPAPNFDLVVQPNDWGKAVKRATSTSSGEVGRKAEVYRAFWDAVIPRIRDEHPTWTRRNTSKQAFMDTIIGVRGVVGSMAWTKAGLVSQLYFLAENPALAAARFQALSAQREVFEAALGEAPVWDSMDGRGATRIYLLSPFIDITERERWPEMIDWLLDTQARLRQAFHACGGVDGVSVE